MFQDSHVLTIDIGSDELKFAYIKISGKNVQLLKLGVKSVHQDKLDSPEEMAFVTTSKTNEFLQEESISVKQVSISFSGQSIFSRFAQLPLVDQTKIYQIVKYEAQQQIPFPLDEVIWDYQMIEGLTQEQLCVLIVAVKKEIIENLVQSFETINIEILAVNINPLSLYNVFIKSPELPIEPAAIIDIGRKTTDFLIIEGSSMWARTIPIAGDSITQELKRELKLNLEEAEQFKIKKLNISGSAIDNERDEKASQTGKLVLNRLLAEVTRSLGFYRTQYKKSEVKYFYITGGTSQLSGLKEFISKRLKSDIHELDPLQSFQSIGQNICDEWKTRKNIFSAVSGMALVSTKGSRKVNLLPKPYIRSQSLKKKRNWILLSAFFSFLIIFYLWGINFYMLQRKQAVLNHINKQIDEIKEFNTQLNQQIKSIENYNNKLLKLDELVQYRRFWLDVFSEVEKAIPDNAWINKSYSNIVGAGTKKEKRNVLILSLNGSTRGLYSDISSFRESLEDSDLFSSVEIKSANPPINGVREFHITMYVKNGENL